ncbi:MAG: hypothetical protein HYW97_00105 [Candidatus Wildermuthbacteria bacterium]|nr:hypothetical protein [Candidatus Wildermuthbacteria bacterium]
MDIRVIKKKFGHGGEVHFVLKAKSAFRTDQIEYLKKIIEAWVAIGNFGLYRDNLIDAYGRFRYLSDIVVKESEIFWWVDMRGCDERALSDLITLFNIFNDTTPGDHPEFFQLESLEIEE